MLSIHAPSTMGWTLSIKDKEDKIEKKKSTLKISSKNTNINKKNENQIWHIKKLRSEFHIKTKLNQIIWDKIERKKNQNKTYNN